MEIHQQLKEIREFIIPLIKKENLTIPEVFINIINYGDEIPIVESSLALLLSTQDYHRTIMDFVALEYEGSYESASIDYSKLLDFFDDYVPDFQKNYIEVQDYLTGQEEDICPLINEELIHLYVSAYIVQNLSNKYFFDYIDFVADKQNIKETIKIRLHKSVSKEINQKIKILTDKLIIDQSAYIIKNNSIQSVDNKDTIFIEGITMHTIFNNKADIPQPNWQSKIGELKDSSPIYKIIKCPFGISVQQYKDAFNNQNKQQPELIILSNPSIKVGKGYSILSMIGQLGEHMESHYNFKEVIAHIKKCNVSIEHFRKNQIFTILNYMDKQYIKTNKNKILERFTEKEIKESKLNKQVIKQLNKEFI